MQLSKKVDLDVVSSSSSSQASLFTDPSSLAFSGTSLVLDFDPHLPYPGCCFECSKTKDLELFPSANVCRKDDVTVHSSYSRATTSSLSSSSIVSTCSQETSDYSTSLSTTIFRLSTAGSGTEECSTAEV